MPPLFDREKCTGCGLCEELCMADAIYSEDDGDGNKIPFVKHPDECWHCGSCRQDCPMGAVTIVFPPSMLII